MKSNPTVRALYLYLFSGLGVILMIIGAYLSVLYFVRITQFEKYPLPSYEETRCDFVSDYPPFPPPGETTVATPTEDTENRRQECLTQLEQTRQRKETEDFTAALTLLVLGGIVFYPHWRAAGRERTV